MRRSSLNALTAFRWPWRRLGTYLSQTVNSFGEYQQLYNEDRTLYSTWNLSLTQIQNQDPPAVELLRLMAYLDNQDLWYGLLQAGLMTNLYGGRRLSKTGPI
jgi:hypothetical protein